MSAVFYSESLLKNNHLADRKWERITTLQWVLRYLVVRTLWTTKDGKIFRKIFGLAES
jgi:hypothetical protein